MLAFLVTETDENTGGIIFAKTPIEARKWGANEFNGGEFGGLSVKRAAWADHYGRASKVPARDLIDMGWWFECSGCGATINTDYLDERRLPLSGVIGSSVGHVYCCAKHYRREQRRRARMQQRQAAAIADFEARVRRRFGDVEFVPEQHHAHCPEDGPRGRWTAKQVAVAFKFPGQQYGPAVFRFDENYGASGQWPPAPYYSCSNGDREVFEAWAKATRGKLV